MGSTPEGPLARVPWGVRGWDLHRWKATDFANREVIRESRMRIAKIAKFAIWIAKMTFWAIWGPFGLGELGDLAILGVLGSKNRKFSKYPKSIENHGKPLEMAQKRGKNEFCEFLSRISVTFRPF